MVKANCANRANIPRAVRSRPREAAFAKLMEEGPI
jgi:hypothetical protein